MNVNRKMRKLMCLLFTLLTRYLGLVCLCVHTQSCLTLHGCTDCSPPGSSVHGIFQTRILQVLVAQSRPTFCGPMNYIAHQAPVSMGFSRQEYWGGLPVPTPGDPPNPGSSHVSSVSCIADRFFITEPLE